MFGRDMSGGPYVRNTPVKVLFQIDNNFIAGERRQGEPALFFLLCDVFDKVISQDNLAGA